MSKLIKIIILILTFISLTTSNTMSNGTQKSDYIKISQDLLYAVRTDNDYEIYVESLKNASEEELLSQLQNDNQKKAFWLNIYNAYTQILLKKDKALYKKQFRFFKTKAIFIAGMYLSFNDIEHNFLRRSKVLWGLGYINKIFVSKRTRQFSVQKVDYRIHFAMNCGAKSCPPIAFYTPEKIDSQLDLATKSYLHQESDYDEEKREVHISKIMSWFRGDFGGISGVSELLKAQNIIPKDKRTKIRFKKYDWTLALDNYQDL